MISIAAQPTTTTLAGFCWNGHCSYSGSLRTLVFAYRVKFDQAGALLSRVLKDGRLNFYILVDGTESARLKSGLILNVELQGEVEFDTHAHTEDPCSWEY